ncbi:alpha/beta fold hydrolase [Enterococcus sp. AZ196]|uniref:alpha/beta fold hydrolase n=1 Tax=Enterococcus sp. AZ196 TaxID=2774659 RepID=UPI003D288CAF
MKLILLHGIGQSTDSWKEVIKNIDNSDICLFPLFENIGPNEYVNFKYLNNKLEAFLRTLNEPFILCGLSLGAILTLQYGTVCNPLLKGLIVVAGQFEAPDKKILKLQNMMLKLTPSFFLRKSGIVLKKKQLLQLMDDLANLQMSNSLQNIKAPTLLLCGSKDKANLSATSKLSNLLKNSTIVIIENGKHELNRSSPEELAYTINRFTQEM